MVVNSRNNAPDRTGTQYPGPLHCEDCRDECTSRPAIQWKEFFYLANLRSKLKHGACIQYVLARRAICNCRMNTVSSKGPVTEEDLSRLQYLVLAYSDMIVADKG